VESAPLMGSGRPDGERVSSSLYPPLQEMSGADPSSQVRLRATRALLLLNGMRPAHSRYPSSTSHLRNWGNKGSIGTSTRVRAWLFQLHTHASCYSRLQCSSLNLPISCPHMSGVVKPGSSWIGYTLSSNAGLSRSPGSLGGAITYVGRAVC
jgi:hypothetical protein